MNVQSRRRSGVPGRLAGRPLGDWIAAARAQWYLVRARRALAITPRGHLLAAVTAVAPIAAPSVNGIARARDLALAVDRAATHGIFRPTCLVRTIALDRMLKRAGVDGAVVRIGARQRDGRPQMHAWIEIGGTVIGEQPDAVGTFTPLHDFTTAGRR
jgi:Transglutaminase-like superfamily